MSMLFCTSKPTNCKSTYIIIKINELNYNGKYIILWFGLIITIMKLAQ